MFQKTHHIIFLTVFCLFMVMPLVTYSQTAIDIQKERVKRLESDIKFLDKQIELTQSQQKSTLNELILLQKKVINRRILLEELDKEINIQDKDIRHKANSIRSLEQRLDTLKHYYKRLIMSTYKSRDTRTWFLYIMASKNIEQGYRRWNYLKNYSKSISKQVEKIKNTKSEILAQQVQLMQLKSNNIKIKENREKEYLGLTKEEQHSRIYSKSLANKQKEYKAQLRKKKGEADRLNKEVERMIAEAIRQEELRKQKEAAKLANNTGNKAPAIEPKTPEADIKLSGDFTSNKGKLPWPVAQGVIIESFGEHNHPTLPNVKLPFNNGINISAPKNSYVTVIFDGVVKQIIAMPGYNQCILVQHGSYFTFYCKLGSVSVKVGDKIKIGTILGTLEDSQNTSVLHFELWNGTTKQNPEFWLK
ncbi:MAG: peptidoglycan DD-metalloendopeptidase family protein [Bacteroidales bacterium]